MEKEGWKEEEKMKVGEEGRLDMRLLMFGAGILPQSFWVRTKVDYMTRQNRKHKICHYRDYHYVVHNVL